MAWTAGSRLLLTSSVMTSTVSSASIKLVPMIPVGPRLRWRKVNQPCLPRFRHAPATGALPRARPLTEATRTRTCPRQASRRPPRPSPRRCAPPSGGRPTGYPPQARSCTQCSSAPNPHRASPSPRSPPPAAPVPAGAPTQRFASFILVRMLPPAQCESGTTNQAQVSRRAPCPRLLPRLQSRLLQNELLAARRPLPNLHRRSATRTNARPDG